MRIMSWSIVLPVRVFLHNMLWILLWHIIRFIGFVKIAIQRWCSYVQKNQDDPIQSAGGPMNNDKVLTDVISNSLTKAVGQLTAAIQDTIKKSYEVRDCRLGCTP